MLMYIPITSYCFSLSGSRDYLGFPIIITMRILPIYMLVMVFFALFIFTFLQPSALLLSADSLFVFLFLTARGSSNIKNVYF